MPSSSEIRAILDDLIRQRRRMDETAEPGLWEANRLGIVYWQWQLSRARAAERLHDAA
jgi:hypothetical protein